MIDEKAGRRKDSNYKYIFALHMYNSASATNDVEIFSKDTTLAGILYSNHQYYLGSRSTRFLPGVPRHCSVISAQLGVSLSN